MKLECHKLTVAELSRRISSGEVSPLSVTEAYLDQIKRLNPSLNAYVTVTADDALYAARVAETEIRAGKYRGALHGIPFSVKDNLATKNVRTTAGSKILSDWIPDFDARVVAILKNSGAILLGKTNMHEWAKGSNSINEFLGAIHNPWDLMRTPGGTSGGSAVAVAAGMCPLSIGTDSAGSVRSPASLCGCVGLKPTHGRISQHGVVPGTGGPSINDLGILTKTVEDCAQVLEVIAGQDANDPASADEPVRQYSKAVGQPVEGLKMGVLKGYFDELMSDEVNNIFEDAVRALQQLGLTQESVSVAYMDIVPLVFSCTMRFEDIAPHDEYMRTRPRDYSPRLLYGQISSLTIPEATYATAQRVRQRIRCAFEEAFTKVDVIVAPTMAIPAPTLEECKRGHVMVDGKNTPLQDARGNFLTQCTIPFNVTGLPALSLCCGFSSAGLPIGLQIIGAPFREDTVVQVAYAYERSTEWHKRQPQIVLP
jgi:aspartyl-tRNA(Asn)/glutamyl-tRNA(Gln) amidotransferase subunit A